MHIIHLQKYSVRKNTKVNSRYAVKLTLSYYTTTEICVEQILQQLCQFGKKKEKTAFPSNEI